MLSMVKGPRYRVESFLASLFSTMITQGTLKGGPAGGVAGQEVVGIFNPG